MCADECERPCRGFAGVEGFSAAANPRVGAAVLSAAAGPLPVLPHHLHSCQLLLPPAADAADAADDDAAAAADDDDADDDADADDAADAAAADDDADAFSCVWCCC